MKKSLYRSMFLSQVDMPRILSQADSGRIVIGVDVAKETNYGCIATDGFRPYVIVRWDAPDETREFVDFVRKLGGSRVEVALESSGTYGDALTYQLRAAGVRVYQVSGKRTHDGSEVYDGVPSMHDAKAAGVITRLHLEGLSRLWPESSAEERTMTAHMERRHLFERQALDNQNRLEAKLSRHWPEVGAILSLSTTTLITLLCTYGSPQAVAANVEEARKLMRATGKSFLSAKKIERVLSSAQNTTGVPMNESEELLMKDLSSEVLRNREKADEASKGLLKASEGLAGVQRMGQVVGPLTAAALVALLGDFTAYDSPEALVKAAGLNLKEWSSGRHRGRLTITKRGSSKARWYLYLATLRMLQTDEYFLAWHQLKVARDGHRTKMTSVIALMRKLLKALWHVARGATYDGKKLFDTRRLDLASAKAKQCGRGKMGKGVCGLKEAPSPKKQAVQCSAPAVEAIQPG